MKQSLIHQKHETEHGFACLILNHVTLKEGLVWLIMNNVGRDRRRRRMKREVDRECCCVCVLPAGEGSPEVSDTRVKGCRDKGIPSLSLSP